MLDNNLYFASRRKLDGVREKIGDDLFDSVDVIDDAALSFWNHVDGFVADLGFLHDRVYDVENVLYGGQQVELNGCQFELLILNFPVVHDIVNHQLQALPSFLNDLQGCLQLEYALALHCAFADGDDACERSLQVMRYVRENPILITIDLHQLRHL